MLWSNPYKKKKKKTFTTVHLFRIDVLRNTVFTYTVPNMCMAHRVCKYCDYLLVDQPCSHCEACGARRHVF